MPPFTHQATALAGPYRVGGPGRASGHRVLGSPAGHLAPEAAALAIFAALGLVVLAIIVQLLSRQVMLDSAEFPVLRALGMTRSRLTVLALARVAVVTTRCAGTSSSPCSRAGPRPGPTRSPLVPGPSTRWAFGWGSGAELTGRVLIAGNLARGVQLGFSVGGGQRHRSLGSAPWSRPRCSPSPVPALPAAPLRYNFFLLQWPGIQPAYRRGTAEARPR
jgi:hypothetical protein